MSTVVSNIDSSQGRSAPRAGRHLPGSEGVWVFVYADMAMFAAMFGCFMWDRHHALELFETSRQALSLNVGGINTLILLTSSMLVVLGVDALKFGRRHLAPAFFGLAGIRAARPFHASCPRLSQPVRCQWVAAGRCFSLQLIPTAVRQ